MSSRPFSDQEVSDPTANIPPAGAGVVPWWTRWWLSALTILILGVLVGLGLHYFNRPAPGPESRTDVPVAPVEKRAAAARLDEIREGPWGRLEIIPIVIRPPMEFVWHLQHDHSDGVTWRFPKMSLSQLNDTLIELGLPDPVLTALHARAKLDPAIDGCTVSPERDLVLGLAPEVRAKLYVLLHHFRENEDQINAFRFCGPSAEAWFGDSPMQPETKRLVTPLIYRDGTFLFFSDLRSVEPLLPSAGERTALIRALTRESTMLLRLQVSQESDVKSLVKYWGRGGRDKEVRPIIESLRKTGRPQSLDVIQLLPPFARQRLYTYPSPGPDEQSVKRDCFWTVMNFFSEQPDDRFVNVENVSQALKEGYYRIYGGQQFGDLVFYLDREQEPVHAAVYIAADVLFTKNGSIKARPWMFIKMEDMKHFYPRTTKKEPVFFRRRGL